MKTANDRAIDNLFKQITEVCKYLEGMGDQIRGNDPIWKDTEKNYRNMFTVSSSKSASEKQKKKAERLIKRLEKAERL